ncbi:hypothetical protein [Terrisporobacter glycolicus]|uniref:Uncharacterized protein n=1 Tax=Terrisporobacter glycolicus ATCC 14880 = DSM 1288 TaxID=1121315 RepID=A0ABZ2EUY9_9FIRM|nr:hypothetical protein [Terrisporobacter glycolicus]
MDRIISSIFVLFYGVMIIGSIILLIMKIIERQKEKKEENLDKYDKY